VDAGYQHQGLGKVLLFDALQRVAEAAEIVAVSTVIVHARNDAARRFYEHFGFDASPVDPFQLMLLVKDIRKALA
jgi:GNAT superfamily N-acetyltransferase